MNNKAIFGIVVVAFLAVGAFYIFSQEGGETTGQAINEQEQEIIASVNGESITLEEVHKTKEILELSSETLITNERALEQIINDKIILQKAEQEGIAVTFEEAEQNLVKQLEGTGRTLEQVKQSLENTNRNYEEEIEYARKQMTIRKYITENLPNPEVTDEEARAYYEQNKNAMFTGEVVPYENIASQLKQAIAQQKQTQDINEYVTELRETAEIVYPNQKA